MMRKGKSILSFSCLFFSVCILFLSCSSEREYLSTDRYEEEETVQVGFHIAFDELSDTRTVTRAGRDGYDNGMETDFENYINFENQDFRILFSIKIINIFLLFSWKVLCLWAMPVIVQSIMM